VIVRATADSWWVIAQAEHARLAGEMVALLRAGELVGHPRRRALLRAVAEHDNGWWEEDAAPRLDPATGGPLDFRSLPAAARRELWPRAIERYAAAEPYLAALVAGHFLRIAPAAALGGGGEALRAESDERRLELLERAGVSVDEAAADDRWLRLGDELSLAAATLDPAMVAAPGWRARVAAEAERIELLVAPFAWAGPTTFALEARRIGRGPYRDAVELGRALVAARRERLAVRLVPL
jgi:hypothetical protein